MTDKEIIFKDKEGIEWNKLLEINESTKTLNNRISKLDKIITERYSLNELELFSLIIEYTRESK